MWVCSWKIAPPVSSHRMTARIASATALTHATRNFAHFTRRCDRTHGDFTAREGRSNARYNKTVHYITRNGMADIGWPELLIIGLVFVLLFGTQKIPGAMKGLGEAIRNFKSSVKGETEDLKKEIEKV
jgi:sec-independent protein translocase protein TatA